MKKRMNGWIKMNDWMENDRKWMNEWKINKWINEWMNEKIVN